MGNKCSSKISERNPIENGLTDTDEITLHGMAKKRDIDIDIDTIKYMLGRVWYSRKSRRRIKIKTYWIYNLSSKLNTDD